MHDVVEMAVKKATKAETMALMIDFVFSLIIKNLEVNK